MKSGKLLLFFISLVLGVILLFLGFVSITLPLLWKKIDSEEVCENEEIEFVYRSRTLNPSKSSSSYGFVTLIREIDDYVFYSNEDGGMTLISDFGTDEYTCHGTCFCEQYDSRRSNIITISSRTIYYLAAALTSVVAFSAAKEYFEEECEKKLSSECPSNAVIRSKVDGCEDLEKTDSESDDREESSVELEGKDDEKMEYFCTGRCLPKDYKLVGYDKQMRQYLKKMEGKVGGCRKLKYDGEIKFDETDMQHVKSQLKGEGGKVKIKNEEEFARYFFIRDFLRKFCSESSETRDPRRLFDEKQAKKEGKELPPLKEEEKIVYLMCDGLNPKAKNILKLNPSVKCVNGKDFQMYGN